MKFGNDDVEVACPFLQTRQVQIEAEEAGLVRLGMYTLKQMND